MREFLKVLCMVTVMLGMFFGALLLLRHLTKRTYITVEED